MTTITQMLVSGQEDLAWFESNLETFKSKYNNEFIAFHNQKILEHDSKLDTLIKKLEERNISPSKVLIRFISKIKAILC